MGFRLGNIKLRSFIGLRSSYDLGRKIIVFNVLGEINENPSKNRKGKLRSH